MMTSACICNLYRCGDVRVVEELLAISHYEHSRVGFLFISDEENKNEVTLVGGENAAFWSILGFPHHRLSVFSRT